ncbi:MAG: DUF3987 domain-containing protein [Bacteroidales bacterium]|jgi:hypothetical protein|nr:DUF3987 domain-containing protein [Bacteroidales bacterium]
MMTYQNSVSSGKPEVLTVEKWNELIDSPKVKNICRAIAALDPNAEDYNDRKQALKKRLPIIIPHAAAFKNGKRVSADAVPSGLAMLDVDHVENPRDFLSQRSKVQSQKPEESKDFREVLIENHIYLVAITASGKGLRVIGARAQGETIEAAQMRMAQALGIEEYDAVTKDLARASYVVPRDYILWMDEAALFAPCSYSESAEGYSNTQSEILSSANAPDDHGVWHESNPSCTASPSATEEHRSEAAEEERELSYKGLPYADIVEELMVQTGNAGGAVQGERNTTLFTLANYMRYICDFNAEVLLRVLPDFGLSEQERRQVIASALGRPRKDQMPVPIQSAIATVEREIEAESDPKSQLPRASEMPLPKLPKLLQLLCRRLPSSYRPAMIVASLPILGTLATKIRFEYLDCQEQSLSFFSCITAPAASGKSFIRKPIDLLLTPINEQDAIEREKEQKYKEAIRAAKNSKFQPEDPHACPRNNGVAISVAKLLQLLTYADGKHLIGYGEEMDTLVKSERAGVWSQKSDIYRLAFDNAEYGQAYMSDQSFNAHIKVYYNLLLTGTPNSMKRFFKDLENGLATRVCFAQLPDTSFAEMPVFAPYTDAEQTEIIRWARRLDTEQGTIECAAVNKAIAAWLEEKRQQAIDADSHAMDTFRRRAAVIGFRAGMLCYLLEDRKPTSLTSAFAKWVAEYVFRNQMELWGEQLEREWNGAFEAQNERGAATSLLNLLPHEFVAADLIRLRSKKGQSVSSASISMLLSRWKKVGRIQKTGDGKWKRLQ